MSFFARVSDTIVRAVPSSRRPLRWQGWRAIALMGVALTGAGCDVAVRQAEAFMGKPKPSEASANLKAAFTAEMAYRNELGHFVESFAKVGFAPENGGRYSYYFAETGPAYRRAEAASNVSDEDRVVAFDEQRNPGRFYPTVEATRCPVTRVRSSGGPKLRVGVTPAAEGKAEALLILAAGNIDGDAQLDCWSISNEDRVARDGKTVPGGQPLHELDDEAPTER